MDSSEAKDQQVFNDRHQHHDKSPQGQQPNVRHIPIFVEGRDEPLLNSSTSKNNTSASNNIPKSEIPKQPNSIFSRVKDLPVRKIVSDFHIPTTMRANSPVRSIPINVVHTPSKKNIAGGPTTPKGQEEQQQFRPQINDPICKIQKIQKDVIELMDHVEKFKGGSRRDREYLYLDEMLTQNLLKLDTIDTEGKESIKAARKEAIKCINKCIAVLEAKTDNPDSCSSSQSMTQDKKQQSQFGENYRSQSEGEKINNNS